MNKIYVGNLPWSVTSEQLQELFAPYGEVVSAQVISDKFSGRSKGFGFVEYGTEEEMQQAIENMNGKELEGRALVVNKARPPEERPRNNNFRRGRDGGRGNW